MRANKCLLSILTLLLLSMGMGGAFAGNGTATYTIENHTKQTLSESGVFSMGVQLVGVFPKNILPGSSGELILKGFPITSDAGITWTYPVRPVSFCSFMIQPDESASTAYCLVSDKQGTVHHINGQVNGTVITFNCSDNYC